MNNWSQTTVDALFLSGIADNNQVRAVLDQQGQFQYLLNGSSSVAPSMEKVQDFRAHRFILGGTGGGQRYGFTFQPSVIFNEISDADTHSRALSRCIDFCRQQGVTVINPPDKIAQTRRDRVAQLLSGLEGVTLPETLRFQPRTPHEVREIISSQFKGPVLLREAGTHGGKSLTLLDNPDMLDEQLYGFALDGRPYYLTRFVDFRDPDGLYRKYRLVVIEGVPYLRHMLIHDHWMVHRTARDFMTAHPSLKQEEQEFLQAFYRKPPPELVNKVSAIAARLQLDYFGIDCHLDQDGNMLVFEANANMNILTNTQPSPNLWDAPIAAIHEHLKGMIQAKGQ